MTRYFLKRLGFNVMALWVIVSLTFFLMKAIPGDPFSQEKALPKEILDALYKYYKLDKPWYEQYLSYLKSIATLNLGPSFKYKTRTVNEIIRKGFPISATLGLEAMVISLVCGICLGSLAALKRSRWQDYSSMIGASIGISIPHFIIAAFLQYLLAIKLDLFPVARWGSWQQTILPALSLAALPTAFIARLTRTSLIEVLEKDYIKTAVAKGLSSSHILFKHALKNSLLPVVTYLGTLSVNIFTGSFVIEKIFGIPGLGQWFINSVMNRDYTVIMGLTVFYSILLLSVTLIVDFIYGLLDPRIKGKLYG